mgnify:CR=1 FL=1
MAVNVKGAYVALRAALPHMIASGGGSVVLTSSVASVVGVPGASKHALLGLARTAALEYAAYDIRVNTLNPAPVRSRMMSSIAGTCSAGCRSSSTRSARDDPYWTLRRT